MTERARRPADERLAGVPRMGDLVGPGAVELGGFAVARMAPAEFERFIESVRAPEPADRSAPQPSAVTDRRMTARTAAEVDRPDPPG